MIIKELTNDYLEEAHKIYCDCFNKEYKNITLKSTGLLLGLFKENTLIGIAQIDYLNKYFENQKIAYINGLCIKEEYRKQGYGDYLLKECIKICKENQADMINLTSNKTRIQAHRLYERNSFEIANTILFKKEL